MSNDTAHGHHGDCSTVACVKCKMYISTNTTQICCHIILFIYNCKKKALPIYHYIQPHVNYIDTYISDALQMYCTL